LTGLRRAGVDAQASRYADVVVVLLLPALALCTQDIARMAVRRFGRSLAAVFAVVVVGFVVVQVVALDHEVQSEIFVGEMKPRVLATAKILRAGEPVASTNIFGIPFVTEPSTSTIARLDRHGELPALDVTRADVLTAREYVEVVIGSEDLYPTGIATVVDVSRGRATTTAAGCVDVVATSTAPAAATLRLPEAASFSIATRRPQIVALRFEEAGATGRPRRFDVGPGAGVTVSVSRGTDVRLAFTNRTTSLCGLAA
jgi:hypothetical protein